VGHYSQAVDLIVICNKAGKARFQGHIHFIDFIARSSIRHFRPDFFGQALMLEKPPGISTGENPLKITIYGTIHNPVAQFILASYAAAVL
jgi:hypothetical protein